MENEYVKLWVSYEAYFEPLGDAEVGRLARAMIEYKSSGAAPKFSGNERFVWPAIKRDIDNAIAAQQELSQTRADSGKLGGRPKKPNAFDEKQKNQMVFEESKKIVNDEVSIGKLKVSKGKVDSVDVFANESFSAVVKKGDNLGYETEVELKDCKSAPLHAGDKVGKVTVLKNGNVVKEIDILVKEDVKALSLFENAKKIVSRW